MASVDVVIPNYNYGRYLRECVMSVLSQDVDNLRVLILDNASTDDSATIARELACADPRVELRLRERNLGQHASFNEGIDWATNDYFMILCSDDILAPGALRRAMKVMDENPNVHLVYGPTLYRSEGETAHLVPADVDGCARIVAGEEFLESFCRSGRNQVTGPMAIVRTAVQKQAGYYSTELPHTDDVELWMRFCLFGSVAETSACQLIGRVHNSKQSRAIETSLQWILEMKAAYDHFFAGAGAKHPRAARLWRASRYSLAVRAYWCAISHFLRGDRGVGELFLFIVKTRPSVLFFPPIFSLVQRPDAWDRIRTVVASAAARLSHSNA